MFQRKTDEVLQITPSNEDAVIDDNINLHVGIEERSYKRILSGYSFGKKCD